jgi:uncharacterized membrane protein
VEGWRAPDTREQWDRFGEQWLGRVGVGFVILALSFLFKLAFDRGWVTPPLRLAFGLLVGAGLLGAGLGLQDSRRRYSQVLMGGAIGVFYLVGFAGYQWYGLLSHTVAFSYMVAVTVLAVVLGVRQDEETLASIGAVGGLATPFLLYTEQGSVAGLMVYTSILVAGAGAVQVWRGWRILQVVLVFGGVAILMIASSQPFEAWWPVPLGAAVWWGVGGVSPLVRRWHQHLRSESGQEAARAEDALEEARFDAILVRAFGVFCSLAAAYAIAVALELDQVGGGILLLGAGALFAAAAVAGRAIRGLAAEVAGVLTPIGTALALSGPTAFLVLGLEVAALHLLAIRAALPTLHLLGHGLVGILGLWFFLGAWERMDTNPLDSWALSTLGAILVASSVAFAFEDRSIRKAYLLGAYVAFMLWLLAELSSLANGPALVSISWGALGVSCLVFGWRGEARELQRLGLVTLAVTAGKLLLVDMVQLDIVWRILVFLGFGAAFLGLGYLINRPAGSAGGGAP